MEQVYFLILVAAVGLLRLFFAAAEKKRNAPPGKPAPTSTAAPLSRAPGETEEDRVRKFFEALGVPPTSAAPPKAAREITPPAPSRRRKILPVDPFPRPRIGTPTTPAASEPARVAAEIASLAPQSRPARVTVPVAAFIPSQSIPAEFEIRVVDEVEKSAPTAGAAPSQSWATRLSTANGLRDAIILREIFGPPRSLQAFDSLG